MRYKIFVALMAVLIIYQSAMIKNAYAGDLVPFPNMPVSQQITIGTLALAGNGILVNGSIAPLTLLNKIPASALNNICLKVNEFGGYSMVVGATAWCALKAMGMELGDNTIGMVADGQTNNTSTSTETVSKPFSASTKSIPYFKIGPTGAYNTSFGNFYGIPCKVIDPVANWSDDRVQISFVDYAVLTNNTIVLRTIEHIGWNGQTVNWEYSVYKTSNNTALTINDLIATGLNYDEQQTNEIIYKAYQNLLDPAGQDRYFETAKPITDIEPLEIDVTDYIADPSLVTQVTPEILSELVVEPVTDPVTPPVTPPDSEINWDKLKGLGSLLTTKFPFSLPWDVYRSFAKLSTSGQAPDWTWEVESPLFNETIDLQPTMTKFEPVRQMALWFELFFFDFGLIMSTRKLFGGAL